MMATVCSGSGVLAGAGAEVLRRRRGKRAEVRRALEERRSVEGFGAVRQGALQRRVAILFVGNVSDLFPPAGDDLRAYLAER